MRFPNGSILRMRPLPGVWLGEVRVKILDQRARGTTFVALPFKSVLNSPMQTGMDFWSVNPYVGCEFGCTYCYARFAHQYVVERASDRGEPVQGDWQPEDFDDSWEIFVTRVFHLTDSMGTVLEAPFGALWAIKTFPDGESGAALPVSNRQRVYAAVDKVLNVAWKIKDFVKGKA